MILPDVNVLLSAYNRDFPEHSGARDWWEATLNGRESVGLAWNSILGFLRFMTHPRAMPNPMRVEDALVAVESWLALPGVAVLEAGPRHAEILFGLLRQVGVGGNLTSDAHLAAIAIEHQARLASLDSDFSRFPGLRWFDPLRKPRR